MGPLKEAAALIVVKSVGLHDHHIFKSSIQKKSVLTKTDPFSFQFLLDNKGRDDTQHVSHCRAHFSHSTENLTNCLPLSQFSQPLRSLTEHCGSLIHPKGQQLPILPVVAQTEVTALMCAWPGKLALRTSEGPLGWYPPVLPAWNLKEPHPSY